MAERYPQFRSVVLDAPDARTLAEFYRRLLGWDYRPGHEPGGDDGFLMITDGRLRISFQRAPELPPATWPSGPVPQQIHLDLQVDTRSELEAQRERAVALGARVLEDRTADEVEPLYVFADPAGHPFCVFVPEGGGEPEATPA